MNFIGWYYPNGLAAAGKIGLALIILAYETFSLPELARTLLLPWRRDITELKNPTLQQIFQQFGFNLVSRLFGLIIRLATLLVGGAITLLIGLMALLILVVLVFLPISLPLSGAGAIIIIFYDPFIVWGYGLLLLTLLSGAAFWLIYQKEYLENHPLPMPLSDALARLHRAEPIGLFPFLDLPARRLFIQCKNLANLRKILLKDERARFIFSRAGINPASLPISANLSITPDKFLLSAGESALEEKHSRIQVGDLIIGLFNFDQDLQKALQAINLELADLKNIVAWQTHLWQELNPPWSLSDWRNLKTNGGIARNWAAGYTPRLDEFSYDITDQVTSQRLDYLYLAHRQNIAEIETILSRSGKHNVILLGSPGVGKRTTVLGFSREVLIGKTPRQLAHKRVVELDINLLLSGSGEAGELEARLVRVFGEAALSGNVILFIDNLERLLGAEEKSVGSINASQIILPYLNSPRLQLIATSNYHSYNSFIATQPGLEEALEKIEIKETDPSQTLRVLQEVSPIMENRHALIILYASLKEIVAQGDRLLPARKSPEKALDLMSEIASFCASHNIKLVTPQIVDQYLSQKTKVPIGKAGAEQKTLLLNLENVLHHNIVNQNQAVADVANALRRSASGVGRQNKPIGNFLFVGPTGVGKTALCKALAQHFFGSEKNMIRLDMSEFQQTSDLTRLIGDQAAKAPGILSSQMSQKPYCLLLLDEFEKAHPNILNLFLQILDEGAMTDAFGEAVIFKNSLIVATSNAGSNFIRQQIKRGISMANLKPQLMDYIQNQNIFKPELLNRFDSIAAFRELTEIELVEVVRILIRRLNQRLKGKVFVSLTAPAQIKLAQIGADPEYGARALERAVQDKIENYIAILTLQDKLAKGQTLVINEKMIQ